MRKYDASDVHPSRGSEEEGGKLLEGYCMKLLADPYILYGCMDVGIYRFYSCQSVYRIPHQAA